MKFLVLIDGSFTGLEAEAQVACKAITGHEIEWRDLEGADAGGVWDAVLLTPGPTGIPAAVLDGFLRQEIFTVEVQPRNTHRVSPDHHPNGAQALFLGAGADSYRLVIETIIAKETAA